jgi:hypothetical protein
MGCSVFTISLALALLVLLAGLFLLAYSKKEGLGILTKIASYAAIAFGTIVFVGGLICALSFGSCHKKQGCKKDGHCKREMSMHCKKNDGKCADMGNCSKTSEKCDMSACKNEAKGCCGEKSCSKDDDCSKDGKCTKGETCTKEVKE